MLPILGYPKCIGARSKGLEPRRPVGVRARRLGQIFTHNSTHPHRRPRSSRAGQASHAPASTLAAGPRVSSHPRRVPATAARALDLRADRPPRDARTGRPFAVRPPPRYCARNPVALGASTLPKGLQVSRSDRRPTSRFPGPFLPLDLDLEEIQRLLQVPQLLFDIALVGR